MYKINTHRISGVRNKVNNPDCRVVITNYVDVLIKYSMVKFSLKIFVRSSYNKGF